MSEADVVRDSLLRLQGWLKPGALKWSRDGLDALAGIERQITRLCTLEQALADADKHVRDCQDEVVGLTKRILDLEAELAASHSEALIQRAERGFAERALIRRRAEEAET